MNEFVTHSATRVMPAAAPKRKRRTGRDIGLVVGAFAATVALVGVGAGGMYVMVDTGYVDTPRTEACVEATQYSDELNQMSEEYSVLVGRAIEAAFSFDEDQVAAVEAEGEAFAARYQATLDAYESASAECRGESR